MLQSVATLLSLLIAGGAVALIAAMLLDDWRLVIRALRNIGDVQPLPVPVQDRHPADRRARVVRISSQSVPQRAAA